MPLRTWLLVPFAVALASTPQAAAKDGLKAKFKVVSASGSEALSFHEESTDSSYGQKCVGSTSSEVSWNSTRPRNLYVFVRYVSAYHRTATVLGTRRVARSFSYVPIAGTATVSRSVDYQETAGCEQEPTDCPETTAKARPFLTGTPDPGASVYGAVDRIRLPSGLVLHGCEYLAHPFVYTARQALGTPTKSAVAIPRHQLLDRNRKFVKGSATVQEPLGGKSHGATASGTYTGHLKVKLKRLKL